MLKEKRILIVDDDAELGTLLAKAVSDMSDTYEVRIAKDVDEAMVQVRKSLSNSRGFDLVITDIKMSGLTGLELLEALQSIAPETKTIAMTAYNSPEIAQRARQLNVQAYLIKPFVISEFRQIVRDTLNVEPGPGEPKRQRAEEALSADQKNAVSRELTSLRMMTGATATLLIHSSGRIMAIDTIEPDSKLDEVCTTLESMHRSMSEQMSLAFARDCQVKQSYFGTDSYSVCTYRVNAMYAAAVIFGPAVKEGQVWYYLQKTVQTLGAALAGTEAPAKRERRQPRHDVFDMLDRFFPDRAGSREKRQPEAPLASDVPVMSKVPLAPEISSLPQAEEPPVAVSSEPEAVLDIDWDVSTDVEWEDLVEETQKSFDGLTLEEAQKQGILASSWEAEPIPPSEEEVDTTIIDDIDWDVATDMDWDTIVEETDKGLKGISFDEAQQRGLVGDIADE